MAASKIPVSIIGATGMVGQRFVQLMANHPWFEIQCVAASKRSASKTYIEAVFDRWAPKTPVPENVAKLQVMEVEKDIKTYASQTSCVFSALSMDKEQVRQLEIKLAQKGMAVISANSAHRWTEDVPMMIPEVNPHHTALIDIQRKNRNWKGFITVKPNCSIQSYVPVLEALKEFEPKKVIVTMCQAISGAGKTFESWPEMKDNVIPHIPGEEKKSEDEPLKIWGTIANGKLILAKTPLTSATCIRVPVTDGHMASVHSTFKRKPSRQEFINAVNQYKNPIADLNLPSAPNPFMIYLEEDNRPQTALDRDWQNGMGITVGKLRDDTIFDWKWVALSHNTLRGAAGGALLTAELLVKKGYIE